MNAAKRFILSENTLIPMSLVITLAGGIYWLAQVQFATAQNKQDVQALSESEEKLRDSLALSMQKQGDLLFQIQSQVSALDAKIQVLVRYAKDK